MTSGGLVVIGAGGHGREAVAIAQAALGPEAVLGVLDDGEPDTDALKALGVDHLGGVGWLAEQEHPPSFVAALGYPDQRRDVVARAEAAGATAATLIHPSAVVGPDVELGPGCIVWPNAIVTTRVRLGRHTHLNTACSVSHDCVLGDFVTVGPGARVCGSVTLEADVWLGASATIIQGRRVGRACLVGAGSVVVRDVPPATKLIGVPAKPL